MYVTLSAACYAADAADRTAHHLLAAAAAAYRNGYIGLARDLTAKRRAAEKAAAAARAWLMGEAEELLAPVVVAPTLRQRLRVWAAPMAAAAAAVGIAAVALALLAPHMVSVATVAKALAGMVR